MEKNFEKFDFKKRLVSMLKVDFRRMFTSNLIYIILGISLVVPILIFVMTSMMEGSTTTNPTTGVETPIVGFESVWQGLGAITNDSAAMGMDLVSMCNINMMYFAVAVLVCLFISDDFRSGYAKNLFTVRSDKTDYIISKTLVCFVAGALMIIAYFIGSLVGGAIANLSFEFTAEFNMNNVIMCLLAKVFLVLVFVPIFVVMSIVGKKKTWLSMILGFGTGMLLFTMVPMITPLIGAGLGNALISLIGGLLFSIGIGSISKIVLSKTSLV